MKILVVEDSEHLQEALKEGLRRSGFTLDIVGDGKEGLVFAEVNEYDVIVLDIMLPRLDGLSILRRLRKHDNPAKVLILSAKDQIEDRVKGLELGADDYLVKPFAFEELVARIKTLGRRRVELKKTEIEIGSITVDTMKRHASINGQVVPLTPTEYNLLEYLALRRGSVISKTQLRDWLYNSDAETGTTVIEVLLCTLRKKLRQRGIDGLIATRRGFGYIIEGTSRN